MMPRPKVRCDTSLQGWARSQLAFSTAPQARIRTHGPPDPATHGGARGPRSRLLLTPALGLRLPATEPPDGARRQGPAGVLLLGGPPGTGPARPPSGPPPPPRA